METLEGMSLLDEARIEIRPEIYHAGLSNMSDQLDDLLEAIFVENDDQNVTNMGVFWEPLGGRFGTPGQPPGHLGAHLDTPLHPAKTMPGGSYSRSSASDAGCPGDMGNTHLAPEERFH